MSEPPVILSEPDRCYLNYDHLVSQEIRRTSYIEARRKSSIEEYQAAQAARIKSKGG